MGKTASEIELNLDRHQSEFKHLIGMIFKCELISNPTYCPDLSMWDSF